jgi:hypothetical protein
MSEISSPEEKLSAILGHLSDFIKHKLDKKQLKGEYIYPRNQLYQMYFVMSRLDVLKFCKLDFIVNFGVPPTVKTKMQDLI